MQPEERTRPQRGDMPFEFLLKIEEVQQDLERINIAASTVYFGDLSISLWILSTIGWLGLCRLIELPFRVTMNACFFMFANLCLSALTSMGVLKEKWSPTIIYFVLNVCVMENALFTGGIYSPSLTVLLVCPLMLENIYMTLAPPFVLSFLVCLEILGMTPTTELGEREANYYRICAFALTYVLIAFVCAKKMNLLESKRKIIETQGQKLHKYAQAINIGFRNFIK